VESEHFGAGPWFTVQKDGEGWREIDRAWVSDGKENVAVRIEIKMSLEKANETTI
jgi:hypothetical protein